MASKKGRPKQNNNNNIITNDINVEYLSTNVDKFENSVVYFKFTDPKNNLKQAIDTQVNDKDIKLSCVWTTDTQDVILKVKEEWVCVADDLQTLINYVVTIDFNAYSLDTDNGTVKGYYAKIMKIKKKKMGNINDDD